MKSRSVSANPRHSSTRSGMYVLLTLAVAATFLTTQTLAQAPQPPAPQAATTVTTPAPTASPLPNAPSSSSSSEEAQLNLPDIAAQLKMMPALDGAQSSNMAQTPEKPHKGLAKTGAIVGLVFLGFGAGAYALAAGHCNSYASGPCNAFHTGGIVAMAGGGAASATGFYFWFKK